ncbi:MBL fold metallo-hydrolase [Prosthecomicrobium sp. N25]|uniref:MBL fold metallo-hydrolase n=1 Tax=Prosthecomicrobium sp. N25 TaxID=3129254 RepID=UPI003076B6AB
MGRNPYYQGPRSDHFDGERFFVPGHPFSKSRRDLLKWQFGGGREAWPSDYAGETIRRPAEKVIGTAVRITAIGHASFLLQTEGLNILIDPVWSERASPVSWAGPKRVNPPGIVFDTLPPIDAVLVSHNHYDHLDIDTLSRLRRTHRCRILTPLGNDAIMKAKDSELVAEAYDWGARVALSHRVAVHFEPSYHWSARGLGDRMMALWAAFVFETPLGAVYHIADTGYRDGQVFRDMRRKHGRIRLAVIPIGAYEPRWFMRDQHVNPEEAVRILSDCGAVRALGHHWGTFRLTNEGIEEPLRALATALHGSGVQPERFQTRKPGGVFEIFD